MAIEPESGALRSLIAEDEAAARVQPGAFAAFLQWAADRRRQYVRERAVWRQDHPLVDVGALEAQFGVQADILTVEQLKKSGPVLIIGPDSPEEP